jgi:hypothetical protein
MRRCHALKVFFPNKADDYHNRAWEAYNFNQIWKAVSNEPARCYDLRSNYAVMNINKWKYTGPEWFDKLLYLGRSMGHGNLGSTCYYYNLVPLFAEQLEEQTANELYSLLPDLTNLTDNEDQ